jgi:hypothetical protein
VPPEKDEKPASTLSLQTLLISSLSAVAAAVVVPMFWERGSLVATAVTPIIVAVVSELLNRPAKAITAVSPHVTRRTPTGTAVHAATGARGAEGAPPPPPARREDPFGLYEDETRRASRPRRRFPLRLAVITGLIAAVIGAGVVTASELAVFGHQIGNSDRATGLLGGKPSTSSRNDDDEEKTPTPTPTETATEAPTETPTPTETATATPTESATPTVTASPTATVSPQATATPAVPPADATPATPSVTP